MPMMALLKNIYKDEHGFNIKDAMESLDELKNHKWKIILY